MNMNTQALQNVGYVLSPQEATPNLIRYRYGGEGRIDAAAGIHQFIQENPTLCPLFPSETVDEVRNQLPGKKYVLIHNGFISLSKHGSQSLTKYHSEESHKDIFSGVRVDVPVRCGQGVHTLEKAHALFWSSACIRKVVNPYCPGPGCGVGSQMVEYEPSSDAASSTHQAQPKIDVALRAEIHRAVPGKNCVAIVRDIYDSATTPEQRKACFSYLLHYQHYNAEFTESESHRLGYPVPLIAVEEDSGYVRTESHRLLSILETWVQAYLMPILEKTIDFSERSFFGTSALYYLFKICSKPTAKILSLLFSEEMKGVVMIELRGECDLEENIRSQVEAGRGKGNKFLFLFHVENVDCVIAWIASGEPLKIELFEDVFGENFNFLLSAAGGVPDRLAVNDFASQGLGIGEFGQALQNIGLTSPPKGNKSQYRTWSEMIAAIEVYDFKDDEGSKLYSLAIRRWNDCFFQCHRFTEIVSALLVSEVCSWITEEAGIVQWAKAYQNLCEIVMFCIQYSPGMFLGVVAEFDAITLDYLNLDGRFSRVDKSVELYSYGMSSVFDILCQILNRSEAQIDAACIGQNYYETLEIIKKLADLGRFNSQKCDSLDKIVGTPNILIADIHPNNAAKNKLFQNDVAQWVFDYLESNSSKEMVLILDITLNNLSDREVQDLLIRLLPFVQENRLEIYLIQSLAKLVQFGADNFSGGIAICLRPSPIEGDVPTTDSSTTRYKKVFFSLLKHHFQGLISEYFRQVRTNTEWIYHRLAKEFSEIGKSVWIEEKCENEREPGKRGFCAASLTLNGDHNTVYVAINFEPLFAVIGLHVPMATDTNATERQQIIEEREGHVNDFLELILELAIQWNLPLTGRQSFGFSLSNISGAVDSIRLSIGVEKRAMLEDNVQIITGFCNLLSKYVANRHTRANAYQVGLERFKEGIQQLCHILSGQETLSLFSVPLFEDDLEYDPIGMAMICFRDSQLELEVSINSDEEKEIISMADTRMGYHGRTFGDGLSSVELMQLLFHRICFGYDSIHVLVHRYDRKRYVIGGVNDHKMLFTRECPVINFDLEDSIQRGKTFSLTWRGRKYKKEDVFVFVEGVGTLPIKLSQLDPKRLNLVFTQCVKFRMEMEEYEGTSALLKFVEEKLDWNYADKVGQEIRSRGFPALAPFLNELNFANLPLPHDYSWDGSSWNERAVESLHAELRGYGYAIAVQNLRETFIRNKISPTIAQIADGRCKRKMIEGLLEGLFNGSLESKPLSEGAARALEELLLSNEYPHFIDQQFEHWIASLEKKLNDEQLDRKFIRNYFLALFPIVKTQCKSLFATRFSVPLRRIAEALPECQELRRHLTYLENKLISDLRVYENNFTSSRITCLLDVYVNYPLHQGARNQIIATLKQEPAQIRAQWFNAPGFYYAPLDSFDLDQIGVDEDDTIFGKGDSNLIAQFCLGIGCREILVERFKRKKDFRFLFRWAIILQDDTLFQILLDNLLNNPLDKKTLEVYLSFRACLDLDHPIQAALKAALDPRPLIFS